MLLSNRVRSRGNQTVYYWPKSDSTHNADNEDNTGNAGSGDNSDNTDDTHNAENDDNADNALMEKIQTSCAI